MVGKEGPVERKGGQGFRKKDENIVEGVRDQMHALNVPFKHDDAKHARPSGRGSKASPKRGDERGVV